MALTVLFTFAKVAVFVALMLLLGARFLPWALSWVGRLRSRELFSLASLVSALGIAYLAYVLFGVPFALGAFLAGLVLGQSTLSQKAAEQTPPLLATVDRAGGEDRRRLPHRAQPLYLPGGGCHRPALGRGPRSAGKGGGIGRPRGGLAFSRRSAVRPG